MARGEHPQRTPVYGGAMIVAAMVLATAVRATGVTGWPRATAYLLLLAVALVGVGLTFRDWS